MNYSQIISIIGNLNINWPYEVKQYLNTFSFFGDFTGQLLSFDCFFYEIGLYYNSIYIRSITSVLLPILSCSAIAFYYVIKIIIWKKEKSRKIIVALIVVHVIFQPNVLTRLLENFNYVEIYNRKYLFSETDIEWDSHEFRTWVCFKFLFNLFNTNFVFKNNNNFKKTNGFIIPFTLYWTLIYPIFVLIHLIRRRQDIFSLEIKSKFGLFINGYKRNFFYW